MSLFTRVKVWGRVLRAYILTFGGVKSNINDADKTVEAILSGKSLIRFGDGEFGIFAGHNIHYQPWSENLLHVFQNIKADYEASGGNAPFILAVPKKYMQCSGIALVKRRVLVSSWSDSRLFFKHHFNRKLHYGDAFLFEKKNRPTYSKIWECPTDRRTIIFVHNDSRCAQDFARTFKREIVHIPCPSYDAFSSCSEILAEIRKTIASCDSGTGNVQIVLSAGPAGKALAYELSKEGYQCIDTGHCWDDPLES